MQKLRPLLKKLFTPVTIMVIPHSRNSALNFKLPSVVLGLLVFLACVGIIYTASLTVHAVDYFVMKKQYTYLTGQFSSLQSSIRSIRESEAEFKKLFSLGTKTEVLDAAAGKQKENDGNINIEELKKQVSQSMGTVTEIKRYLARELDRFRATPRGWPVDGKVTSIFGPRIHPQTGRQQFHYGVDLSAPTGTPVRATADGIVSFSGWSNGNGNVVVIEHGHGFSTVYAHNSKLEVKSGQMIKQGALIAATGATGNATGPHVHYEVWKNGKQVDPTSFLSNR